MQYDRTDTCAQDLFTAPVLITPPHLLLCYRAHGGGGTQCHRQRQFCYRTLQTVRLFRPDSDELSCRAMRVFQTPNGGNGQGVGGGASQKIRASGSPSQMTHSLPKSQGGGTSLQQLSGSPAQKRMKGINEVASENALPPATSLKAHLHLFHPHTELNWASRGLNTTYITCLCPFGPHVQVQRERQYKIEITVMRVH